ncbi:MAG: mechanosensitive ion channel family protein [Pyrinomonadaceae bacterium]|nr:mechanosensitive ion channel family protein [Pyrinomonadaceae bacterium]
MQNEGLIDTSSFLLAFFQNDTIEEAAKATDSARETVINMMQGFWARLPYIAVGIAVFVLFLILGSLIRRVVKMAVEKSGFDPMIASLIARMSFFAMAIIGFFVAAVVVFPGLTPGDLIAGLGIGSVALGFAFKDILQNLFAGFLILLYRPFKIGDQIKINNYEGTVSEITVRATNIRTHDGERVVIPNSELYMNAVLVKTAFENRRGNFVVGIGYNDDIDQAREIILDVLDKSDVVSSDPAPAVNVVELGDSAVNLKVLYWTSSLQANVREARDVLITKVKSELDKSGIDIPFPQRVVYMQN